MRTLLLATFLLCVAALSCAQKLYPGVWQQPRSSYPPYGVPTADSLPSYAERAIVTWYNYIRSASTGFTSSGDYFNSGSSGIVSDSSYSGTFSSLPVPAHALRWEPNLDRLARAGSWDASQCPGKHGLLCNGTYAVSNFSYFYNVPSSIGEVTFATPSDGYYAQQWPFWMASTFACGGQLVTSSVGTSVETSVAECKADAQAHGRQWLMTYDVLGCGVTKRSSGVATLCEFADLMADTDDQWKAVAYGRSQSPVASGAHVAVPSRKSSAGQYMFVATYDADEAATSAVVVLDEGGSSEQRIQLTKKHGSSTYGTWVSSAMSLGSSCKPYYFVFNGKHYYPATGSFLTYGDGCTNDYTQQGGAVVTASSSSGTPATPDTKTSSSYHDFTRSSAGPVETSGSTTNRVSALCHSVLALVVLAAGIQA
eukprot:m51a1_g3068 hypothetical protein (424) ;mRNA; r:7706-9452